MREKNDKEREKEENQIVIAVLIGDSLCSVKGRRREKEAENEEGEKWKRREKK